MAAMRAPEVKQSPSFAADLDQLRDRFPEIDAVIVDLRELLILGYYLPQILIDSESLPGVYAVKLDYPPHGPEGLGAFLVIYHKTEPTPSMVAPLYQCTLLTITELGRDVGS